MCPLHASRFASVEGLPFEGISAEIMEIVRMPIASDGQVLHVGNTLFGTSNLGYGPGIWAEMQDAMLLIYLSAIQHRDSLERDSQTLLTTPTESRHDSTNGILKKPISLEFCQSLAVTILV